MFLIIKTAPFVTKKNRDPKELFLRAYYIIPAGKRKQIAQR